MVQIEGRTLFFSVKFLNMKLIMSIWLMAFADWQQRPALLRADLVGFSDCTSNCAREPDCVNTTECKSFTQYQQ